MTRLHLQEQVAEYGGQSLINLVNQKGHEQPVKEAYESAVSQVGCFCVPPHLLLMFFRLKSQK